MARKETRKEAETKVFDSLTVVYRIEEDEIDWEAARGWLFGLTFSDLQLRAHLGDLAEARRSFEIQGTGVPGGDVLEVQAAGNMILYLLPVPDPMVSAEAYELDRALRALDRVGALEEANLFLAKPYSVPKRRGRPRKGDR